MADGMNLAGDWKAEINRLRQFPDRMRHEVQLATRQNAVGLEGEIKDGIKSQAPGGEAYKPLSPITEMLRLQKRTRGDAQKILRKAFKMWQSGSGTPFKALMDHGDLLGSITHHLFGDGMSAAIGVNRHARSQDGKSMVDIARIVFYGAIIPVTARMRGYFFYNLNIRKSNAPIVIPPRPTIEPVFKVYRPVMVGRYVRALRRAAKI